MPARKIAKKAKKQPKKQAKKVQVSDLEGDQLSGRLSWHAARAAPKIICLTVRRLG